MITTAYDQITFYVDPTALLLLGILLLVVVVLISLDFVHIEIHPGNPRYYPPICHQCGKPWDGNHFCR